MGTIVKTVSPFYYYITITFRTFLETFFSSDYPGCTNPASNIDGSGFPNSNYNGRFDLLRRDNDLVLYNYHAVFEKGDYCIWFEKDLYWHMGNCKNLGENSVYILKKRNMECPNNLEQIFSAKTFEYEDKFTGSWFSGDTNLGESGKTVQNQEFEIAVADGSGTAQNSPTAAVTYAVRDGRYFQKCRWQKSPRGNWRCVPRHNQGKFWLRKLKYRISANSFRGNYSFLNLALCTVTFGDST